MIHAPGILEETAAVTGYKLKSDKPAKEKLDLITRTAASPKD
jgi:hypothetical protein